MDKQQTTDRLFDACEKSINDKLFSLCNYAESLYGKLSVLSPLSVFERGYCSAVHKNKTLQNAADAAVGDLLTLKMRGGELDCTVNERRISDDI